MDVKNNRSKVFKLSLGIIISIFALLAVYLLSSTIVILIISILLAYILDPIASYFEYRGLSRTQGTLIVFALFALLLGSLFYFIIPAIINQISNIQLKNAKINYAVHGLFNC